MERHCLCQRRERGKGRRGPKGRNSSLLDRQPRALRTRDIIDTCKLPRSQHDRRRQRDERKLLCRGMEWLTFHVLLPSDRPSPLFPGPRNPP